MILLLDSLSRPIRLIILRPKPLAAFMVALPIDDIIFVVGSLALLKR